MDYGHLTGETRDWYKKDCPQRFRGRENMGFWGRRTTGCLPLLQGLITCTKERPEKEGGIVAAWL